jgi:hypothetical protein
LSLVQFHSASGRGESVKYKFQIFGQKTDRETAK